MGEMSPRNHRAHLITRKLLPPLLLPPSLGWDLLQLRPCCCGSGPGKQSPVCAHRTWKLLTSLHTPPSPQQLWPWLRAPLLPSGPRVPEVRPAFLLISQGLQLGGALTSLFSPPMSNSAGGCTPSSAGALPSVLLSAARVCSLPCGLVCC